MNFVVNLPGWEDCLPAIFDSEPCASLFEEARMEDLAVLSGLFKSKGDARKNGFSGPIPWGLNLLGTKRRRVWVWNPVKTEDIKELSAFDHTEQFFAASVSGRTHAAA